MSLLSFYLAPIVVIGVVILIEVWLRGRAESKQYIAVRIASGLGGYASIWLLYLLVTGLLYLLGTETFGSVYSSQVRWRFSTPMGQVERAVLGGVATMGGLLLTFFKRRIEHREDRPWLKYLLIWRLGVFGGCLILPLACGLAGAGLPLLEGALYAGQPGLYTRSLEAGVVTHLCQTLQLEPTDHRCQTGPVYTRDFLADLRDHYYITRSPRTEVDSEIGAFHVTCSAWGVTISDGAFQDCYYRFANDRSYLRITYRREWPEPFSGAEIGGVPPDNSGGEVYGMDLELDP